MQDLPRRSRSRSALGNADGRTMQELHRRAGSDVCVGKHLSSKKYLSVASNLGPSGIYRSSLSHSSLR